MPDECNSDCVCVCVCVCVCALGSSQWHSLPPRSYIIGLDKGADTKRDISFVLIGGKELQLQPAKWTRPYKSYTAETKNLAESVRAHFRKLPPAERIGATEEIRLSANLSSSVLPVPCSLSCCHV